MKTFTFNGYPVNYNDNGYNSHVILDDSEHIDMSKHVSKLHKLGREHYELPNAIRGCACSSCNAARKSHGIHGIEWPKQSIRDHGVAVRYNATQSEIEHEIDRMLHQEFKK